MILDSAFHERTDTTTLAESSELSSLSTTAQSALEKTGRTWLRRVIVVTSGGSVTLRGIVPSYYLKQLAQATVLSVPGIEVLRNELEVKVVR